LIYTGRNSLLGNSKKIAKFLMRTFSCRSSFLYASKIIRLNLDRPPDEGVGGGVPALLTAHHYWLVRTTCTEITSYCIKSIG
jgi:hypothetical protein